MVEYKLSANHNCKYDQFTTDIWLGLQQGANFLDNELIEYISDCLIHEHMHKVLHKMFDLTTCKLFDAIEHHFNNRKLVDKALYIEQQLAFETYQTYIKRGGFQLFLNHYHIDNDQFNQATIICNSRFKGGA